MTLTDKLTMLMAERGLNKKQFSEQSNIPYMTIINFYEKGTENVKLSTLKKIASFFNVSLDYIANDSIEHPLDIERKPVQQDELSPDKEFIIKAVKNLSEHQAKVARSYMELLIEQQNQQKP